MSSYERVDVDLSVQPKQPEKSLGQLFSDMTSELGTLVRKEFELAKVETKEELGTAGKAVGMLGGGGAAAFLGVLFVSFALAWLLDQAMNRALAFLIVGVLYAVAAAVMVSAGRKKLRTVKPVPETTQTLREDMAWAKAQRS